MQLKGYEVRITCNGKTLPEYSVRPEDDGSTLVCFVPSESSKNFTIEWHDHCKETHLRFVSFIDGRDAGGNWCSPGGKGYRSGIRVNPTTRQLFRFANLQTTDDDGRLGMMHCHAKLGDIEVRVCRIRAEVRSVPHTWSKFQPMGAVHERSKKAGVHCVELGEERRVHTKRTQSCSTPLVPGEGDVAKFIFRYRPLALLQAQGLIPPSEVNKPNTSDNELKLRPSGSGLGETSGIASNSQRRVTKRSRRHIEADEEEDVKPDLSTIGFDDVHSEEDIEVLETKLEEIRRLQNKFERVIKRRKSEGGSKLSATRPETQVSVKTEEDSAPFVKRRRSDPVTVIDLTLGDAE